MVQVPVFSSVTCVLETVQTLVVSEVKLTARPELDEALTVTDVPSIWLAMEWKVMDCGSLFTVKHHRFARIEELRPPASQRRRRLHPRPEHLSTVRDDKLGKWAQQNRASLHSRRKLRWRRFRWSLCREMRRSRRR